MNDDGEEPQRIWNPVCGKYGCRIIRNNRATSRRLKLSLRSFVYFSDYEAVQDVQISHIF